MNSMTRDMKTKSKLRAACMAAGGSVGDARTKQIQGMHDTRQADLLAQAEARMAQRGPAAQADRMAILRKYGVKPMMHGGAVHGPGGPMEDKVGPVMLSDGEYVLPAATVEAVGEKNLDALRAATGPRKSGLRGMAFGGKYLVDEIDDIIPDKPKAPAADPLAEMKQRAAAEQLRNSRIAATEASLEPDGRGGFRTRPGVAPVNAPPAQPAPPGVAARASAAAQSTLDKAKALPSKLRGAAGRFGLAGAALAGGASALTDAAQGNSDFDERFGIGPKGPYDNPVTRAVGIADSGLVNALNENPVTEFMGRAGVNTLGALSNAGAGALRAGTLTVISPQFADQEKIAQQRAGAGGAGVAPKAAPTAPGTITPERINVLRSAGVRPTGPDDPNLYRPDDAVVGQFQGRNITQREAIERAGGRGTPGARGGLSVVDAYRSPLREQAAPSFQVPGIGSNAAAINKRFDELARGINDLHSGARFQARGTLANKLLRLEEARAQALGGDVGAQVTARGQDINANTAIRGQDLDAAAANASGRSSALRTQLEAQKFGLERADANFKRFRDQARGLFRTKDADGKDVEDVGAGERFMASLAANAPELLNMDPTQAAPYLLEAQARFLETEAANAANPDQQSVIWSRPIGAPVTDVTAREVFEREGVDKWDYARANLDWLPGVDDYQGFDDTEGRRVRLKKGDRDQLRRHYGE